ncbi:MAG: rRNA cytosine-C5-methyltransferase [Salibacteraceae bacterium]
MNAPLPVAFKTVLTKHFGSSVAQRVLEALEQPPNTSVRLNAQKPHQEFENSTPVPWCSQGKLLTERPSFITDPFFHAGCYYVQDASSMIFDSILKSLPMPHHPLVLDLCASPGGKTLVALDAFENGLIVANEIDGRRNNILCENLLKWGRSNFVVTQATAEVFSPMNSKFDLVMVDAPCSGEGMFRKEEAARLQWSESLIHRCSTIQGQLIERAVELVKPGGFLIYSTCTLNETENEMQVHALLNRGFELVQDVFKPHAQWLIEARFQGNTTGYYLLPGISPGEGLFVSVLRKVSTDEVKTRSKVKLRAMRATPAESFEIAGKPYTGFTHIVSRGDYTLALHDPGELFAEVSGLRSIKLPGRPLVQTKGKAEIPQHGAAMLPGATPEIELTKNQALDFLRKHTIFAPENLRGWKLVGIETHALGWIKCMPGRTNNYYPTEMRIKHH